MNHKFNIFQFIKSWWKYFYRISSTAFILGFLISNFMPGNFWSVKDVQALSPSNGKGVYTNLCGTNTAATADTCDKGCNTNSGSCTGFSVVRWQCDGKKTDCRSGESSSAGSQSLGDPGYGKTVQIDVYDKVCREPGTNNWICTDANLKDYIVWYSGDDTSVPQCSFSSTQARLQKNDSDPWANSKTINVGEQIKVGGFHNTSGQLASASEVSLNVTGPTNFSNVGNGTFITPTVAGTYTLTVTTPNQSGANCQDAAAFQVQPAQPVVCVLPPTGLSSQMSDIACNTTRATVTLFWDAQSGAQSYYIRAKATDGSTGNIQGPVANNCPANTDGSSVPDLCINKFSGNSMRITVATGKTYQWWVHSYSNANPACLLSELKLGPQFSPTASTCPNPPAAPTINGSCSAGSTTPVLTWNAPAGAVKYNVRVDPQKGTASFASNNCSAHAVCVNNWSNTSLTFQGSSGGSYKAWVEAVNAAGQSSVTSNVASFECTASPVACVAPVSTLNAQVGNILCDAKTANVILSWNKESTAQSYYIRAKATDGSTGNIQGPVANNCPANTDGSSVPDLCINKFSGNSMRITVATGKTYQWWVHSYSNANPACLLSELKLGPQFSPTASTCPGCIPDGSCSAAAPACGKTTTGKDNCNNTCQKEGAPCPVCVPDNSCSVQTPSTCGSMNQGLDNCNNVCTRSSAACAGGETQTINCLNGTSITVPISQTVNIIELCNIQTQHQDQTANGGSATINFSGNVGVGGTAQVLGVTTLPKTGLPALAWSALAFIPAGFGMKRFRGLKKTLADDPNYIWEDRKFKRS